VAVVAGRGRGGIGWDWNGKMEEGSVLRGPYVR
jgi:hypothetical protein